MASTKVLRPPHLATSTPADVVWLTFIFWVAKRANVGSDVRATVAWLAFKAVKAVVVLLPEEQREESLQWVEGEVAAVQERGGSGAVLCMCYFPVILHRVILCRWCRVQAAANGAVRKIRR